MRELWTSIPRAVLFGAVSTSSGLLCFFIKAADRTMSPGNPDLIVPRNGLLQKLRRGCSSRRLAEVECS